MSHLTGKSILVTGATGSFGRALVARLLRDHQPDRVVVFSRDELKQYDMRREIGDDPRMRYFLGDIRDASRLELALDGVQLVVHAAALKQVDTAELNPTEYIQTNIIGSQNVIRACLTAEVEKVIALSTDKASSPVNLYGATKLAADRLFIASNHYAGTRAVRFSVVRYGNVLGSRGSVVPHFRDLGSRRRPIPITDPRMTRFWITLPQAVSFVVDRLADMRGGELFVPKLPSMKLLDMASALAPESPIEVVGIRPGEKLHEEMISAEESRNAYEHDNYFEVLPTISEWSHPAVPTGQALPDGFSYRSDTNTRWLDAAELHSLLEGEQGE